MSTALANRPQAALITMPEAIEAALIHGDLEKLDAPGRLSYYKEVCKSLGLNPLTKPFDYIRLNNKLTLYAKRDCTDQLRSIHGVSITNLVPQQMGDLFVVTASAKDRSDRTDTSTGAVATAGLKGEALANAMMKAETKAKRRVTLSLCGLGFLDETEVETIPDARPEPVPAGAVPAASPSPAAAPQATAGTQAPRQSPPPAGNSNGHNSRHRVNGNVVSWTVKSVLKKGSDKKQYRQLIFEGGAPFPNKVVTCWHVSLFDALDIAAGKLCQLEVDDSKSEKFVSVEDVLAVSSQDYRDGKPFNPDDEPQPEMVGAAVKADPFNA